MAVDELAAVGEDSIGYLEDAKRGKKRKFAMICKGAQIVSLVVYKKGSLDNYKKQAKSVGKGQFYHGIIDGKGLELNFKLARADGFDQPPTKTKRLKDFLAENTPFKFKPLFEIVEVQEPVLDDEDPLTARFLQLQDAGVAACEAHPDRAAEINTLCRQIGNYLDADQGEQSEPLIAQLETLIRSLAAEPTTGGDIESGGPASTDEAERKKLADALKKLVPLAQKALAAQPARKQEILGPAASIRALLDEGKLSEAREALLTYGVLLKQLMSGPSDGASSGVSLVKLGKARLEWMTVRDAALRDIGRLKDAIVEEFRDDTEQTSQLTVALGVLDKTLAEIDNSLHEELDAVLNAADAARPPLVRQTRDTMSRFTGFLASDPVMAEIDDNEVLPGLLVRAPLESKLADISAALG